jgi:hypothetical protein
LEFTLAALGGSCFYGTFEALTQEAPGFAGVDLTGREQLEEWSRSADDRWSDKSSASRPLRNSWEIACHTNASRAAGSSSTKTVSAASKWLRLMHRSQLNGFNYG